MTANEQCAKPQTLCYKCKTPSPICPWKYNFTPVEGWEAEATKVKVYGDHVSDSYRVISCPLFEENTREKPVKI